MPQKDQNYNDKNLKRALVKILIDSLAINRTVYQYH
jgi:hypothetical protein